LLFKVSTTLPDNWIYLHSPEVTAGRCSYKAESRHGADDHHSSVGFEYFALKRRTVEFIDLGLSRSPSIYPI
jgi:hypothetical protein